MRVLVVENDTALHSDLVKAMAAGGAIIDQLDSGEEAVEMVRHYDYDIVLLGLVLADMDGYEVVRRMRAGGAETPVLVLSQSVQAQARVKAFAMGADDVMTRPYDLAEALARVRAIIRRSKGYSQPKLQVGDVQLSLDTREVQVADTPVHLTGKEYAILELLVLRKGMVLTKEMFLNHLYGGMDEPEVKIIDVFICKLRRKLAEAGARDVIGTVWGRGYTVRDPSTAVSRATLGQPSRTIIEAAPGNHHLARVA